MGLPEENFYKATFKKVVFLITEYLKLTAARNGLDYDKLVAQQPGQPQVQEVKSMKQLKSMVQGG